MHSANVENAIRAVEASDEEAALLRRAWEAGGRARGAVEGLVRARVLRLLVAGPPGSGKTTAVQALSRTLSGGLDCLDVDHDSTDPGHDQWRQHPIALPPFVIPAGERATSAALRKAAAAAYDGAFASLTERTSEIAADVWAGRSSGAVIDTASTLVDYLVDSVKAQMVDLGADAEKEERMAQDRLKGQFYGASNLVVGQVFRTAEEGLYTAAPGPVLGIALTHARPVFDDKRVFKGWTISVGPVGLNVLRGKPDFAIMVGMSPSDKPDAKRLRYHAEVDEADHADAKARWSKTPDGKIDPAERGPAVKALAALDLGAFVHHVWRHRRALNFARVARALDAA